MQKDDERVCFGLGRLERTDAVGKRLKFRGAPLRGRRIRRRIPACVTLCTRGADGSEGERQGQARGSDKTPVPNVGTAIALRKLRVRKGPNDATEPRIKPEYSRQH